jgi:hypothetical protein
LTGPWVKAPPEWETLRKAQANAAARPEFKGNVLFVETHDFVRKPEESPNPGHGHHEFGNAETYFLVGDALGKGMKQLLATAKDKDPVKYAKQTSHTNCRLEEWTSRGLAERCGTHHAGQETTSHMVSCAMPSPTLQNKR